MHSCEQWWLVITRPLGDTKLPEQPPASRTDERRTWSSQAWSGLKPYFCATRSDGNWLSSHMPSSEVGESAGRTGVTVGTCALGGAMGGGGGIHCG